MLKSIFATLALSISFAAMAQSSTQTPPMSQNGQQPVAMQGERPPMPPGLKEAMDSCHALTGNTRTEESRLVFERCMEQKGFKRPPMPQNGQPPMQGERPQMPPPSGNNTQNNTQR